MDKIFTFQFEYDGIDDFGTIEFCAKSREEAVGLFNEWCVYEAGLAEPIAFRSVQVIHDDDDKDEYGELYGEPEEYKAS
jgi:hypothetical protein